MVVGEGGVVEFVDRVWADVVPACHVAGFVGCGLFLGQNVEWAMTLVAGVLSCERTGAAWASATIGGIITAEGFLAVLRGMRTVRGGAGRGGIGGVAPD